MMRQEANKNALWHRAALLVADRVGPCWMVFAGQDWPATDRGPVQMAR